MKTLQARSDRSQAGSALVLSVVAVMIVSILAASFLQLSTAIGRRMSSSSDTLVSLNLAEAGLAEAYSGLAIAKTGNVGSQTAPAVFGGGLFWVEATRHASGMVELKSTGMYGTGRATLGLAAEPVDIGVAGLGFFTRKDLRLNPDVRLDSYDSKLGGYLSQVGTSVNNQTTVGSNGDVSVASGNLIFGDVVYGSGSTLKVASGSTITGGTSPRADSEVLPPIIVPSIPLQPAVKYSGAIPMVVPPGEAGFDGLNITKGAKLILKGPLTLVVGDLQLSLGAEMQFDTTDGPIELHVTGNLDLKSDTLVSNTSTVTSDTRVFVSGKGKTVNFGSKSTFYGFIYAPDSTVHISAQYEVFGGVVCDELQLAALGKMHYDLALGPTLESILPTLRYWRVVDIPAGVNANRMDPFQVLGLDRNALASPADSHEDQVLDLRYVDLNGNRASYFGLESDFDWSQVQTVLFGTRDGVAFYLPDDYATNQDVANDPNLDLVNSTLSSKQLRDALLAAGTLSEDCLTAACLRDPPMSKSDLTAVLKAQPSLTDLVLIAAVDSLSLDSSSLTALLIDNSPLSPVVLDAVLKRDPPLALSDLTKLLSLQP